MAIEALSAYLLSLGVNVAGNAVYDYLKSLVIAKPSISTVEVQDKLASFLSVDGANMKAEQIIAFLANRGDIVIRGSNMYSMKSITMASSAGTSFNFADGSRGATDKSSIDAGRGATVMG